MISKKTEKISLTIRLALALIGVVIAIVFFEVGIRTLKRLKTNMHYRTVQNVNENDAYEKNGEYRNKYANFALMRFSSFLGYFPVENHSGKHYVSNQYGFRYKEDFPIEKPSNEIRIFVTGGSTAWGTGASQDDIYSAVAERKLQKKFKDIKIRVISAGVGGYRSTHERVLILNKILNFNPDIVVMYSGWNDTYSGYRGKRVNDDTYDFQGAASTLAKYNRQYSMGDQEIIDKMDPPQYGQYIFKTYYLVDRFLYRLKSRKKMEQTLSQNQVESAVILEDLKDNIKVIADVFKRKDCSLIFYLQPSLYNTRKKLSPYEDYLAKKNKKQYIGFSDYNSKLYDLFREYLPNIAAAEGFMFVNGDMAIANEPKTAFDDHVHFGDRGNRLIGEHLAGILSNVLTDYK